MCHVLRPISCIVKGTVRITLCLVQVISFFGLWFLYLSCGNVSLSSSFYDCQVGHGQAASFPGQISQTQRPRTPSAWGRLPGAPSRPAGLEGLPSCTGAVAPRGSGSRALVLPFCRGQALRGPSHFSLRRPRRCLRFEGGWAGSKALLAPALEPSGLSLHLRTSLLLSATWEGVC